MTTYSVIGVILSIVGIAVSAYSSYITERRSIGWGLTLTAVGVCVMFTGLIMAGVIVRH